MRHALLDLVAADRGAAQRAGEAVRDRRLPAPGRAADDDQSRTARRHDDSLPGARRRVERLVRSAAGDAHEIELLVSARGDVFLDLTDTRDVALLFDLRFHRAPLFGHEYAVV